MLSPLKSWGIYNMFKAINGPYNESRSCIKINDMYTTFLMLIQEVIRYRRYFLICSISTLCY